MKILFAILFVLSVSACGDKTVEVAAPRTSNEQAAIDANAEMQKAFAESKLKTLPTVDTSAKTYKPMNLYGKK